MTGARAFVVNSSHPELDQLAGELAARGVLREYVGRYFPSDLPWEHMMQRFGFTRRLFAAGPGRRSLPEGLELAQRSHPGVLFDFAGGAVPRSGKAGEHVFRMLLRRRNQAIIHEAVRRYNGKDPVIANFSVAMEIFRKANQANRLTILNSPQAHAASVTRILAEEAGLKPEFAADLRDQAAAPELFQRLEEEVAAADRIFVGSSFAGQTFVSQGVPPEKIFVSTYGVQVDQFATVEERVPDGTFRAIFVGQISQRKGITYLFDAWRSVAGPGMELVLAGHMMAAAGPCQPYASLFRHVGFLNRSELRDLFRQTDVLVLPSLVEGMPLVVLQAMAARVPVIVTANGPGDVVRDGVDGFVVPIRDSGAIAEKLLWLKCHPEARVEMGRRAHERALYFNWSRYRRSTADEVELLMAAR